MNFPTGFQRIWWGVLSAALAYLLSSRIDDLQAGTGTEIDAFLLLVLVALLLVPLFQEIGFFGMTFKAQIADVRNEVREQVTQLRTDIANIAINAQISPTINVNQPPPDSQLPELEDRIRLAIQQSLGESVVSPQEIANSSLQVPGSVLQLFGLRYNLERELRGIWESNFEAANNYRRVSINQMLNDLRTGRLVQNQLLAAFREVYSVCSPAVHAEEVSENQVAFAMDLGPELVRALRQARNDT